MTPTEQEPLGSISIAGELQTHGGVASLRSDDTIELASGGLIETGGGIVELISPTTEISAPIDTGGGTLLVVDSTQITLNAEAKTQGGSLAFSAAGGAIDIQAPITTEGGSISISSSAVEDSEGNLEGGSITISGPGNVIDSQLALAEEIADDDIGGSVVLVADSDIHVDSSIRSGGAAISFVGLGEFASTGSVNAVRETLGTQGQLIAGVLAIKAGENTNIGGDLSAETLNISGASSNDGTLTFLIARLFVACERLSTNWTRPYRQSGFKRGPAPEPWPPSTRLPAHPASKEPQQQAIPCAFAIIQDADISDSTLPGADQFGAGNVAGLEYRLQSIGTTTVGNPPVPQTTGFISLETPEKFAGSQLQLEPGWGPRLPQEQRSTSRALPSPLETPLPLPLNSRTASLPRVSGSSPTNSRRRAQRRTLDRRYRFRLHLT